MLSIGKKNKWSWLFVLVLLATSGLLQACASSPQPERPGVTPVYPPDSSPTPVEINIFTQTAPPATAVSEPTLTAPVTPDPSAAPSATVYDIPNPQGFSLEVVLDGLDQPVALTHAGDSSGRQFVVEQPGRILIARDGRLVGEPYLDITRRVGSRGSEQGLLGLAFHPDYRSNGYFYVNYTDRDGNTVISRFSVSSQNPDLADLDSEKRLLDIPQPYPNHNGGSVVFGPDGYLYLGLGDGGAGGDPQGNAQNTGNLLGKILRIDVDHGDPYAIPADNPFAQGGGSPEIWAYGLRNPWRFSFDVLTGDLYIGDVGQNTYEEINFLPAQSQGGTNFGWDYREGSHPFEGSAPAGVTMVDPVWEYDHSQGCSVTGGVVYRGQLLPEWQGVYLYGDYCSGSVWGLVRGADGGWKQALVFDSGARVSSFGEDESGEIYVIGHGGRVFRLVQKP